jgi:hypothetical protein
MVMIAWYGVVKPKVEDEGFFLGPGLAWVMRH